MKFSWVIPTYGKFNMLFNECIDSFVKYHGTGHEIVVAEDGSKEEQKKIVDECRKRGIVCIASPSNSGFPINSNRGMRAATGDIIVMVNNDIVFTQSVIEQFRKAFEKDPKIGVVGALLFYPDGKTIQHGGHMFTGAGFTHRGWHRTVKDAPEVLKPMYMIGVTGALFAFRKKMLDQIGMFNENYFLACDDSEICLRAWANGWRVFYEPSVQAIHAEGATRGRTNEEKIRDHLVWFKKEMATWNLFFNCDMKKFNMPALESKVNEANVQLLGLRKPDPRGGRMTFQSGAIRGNETEGTILVRRTGAMGDVLLATGVIRKLKNLHPNHKIIVSTVCTEIFKNNPHVSQVVKAIDGVKHDKFIDLDLAYENRPKIPIWEAYAQVALNLGGSDYLPELVSTAQDFQTLKAKLGSVNLETDRIAVLHMGVSWVNRTWPRHQWIEVARNLASAGYKVIVVGRGADFKADLYAGISNLVDHLSIFEIRELCMRAKVFVGVDSGILHIAQTTSVPIVGIFTVANPEYRIFPNRMGKTIAVFPKSLECKFCLHEKAPPVTFVECRLDEVKNQCLADITVSDVISAIDDCVVRT